MQTTFSTLRLPRLMTLAALALAALVALAQPARAEADASSFIDGLGAKALSSLTAPDLPMAEREKRVRSLLRANFDVDVIARFTLGRNWKAATDAQKAEYIKLFETMIVKTYAQRFSDYSGQQLKVGKSTKASERDSIVDSQIIQKNGPPVSVQWRVRDTNGSMKVIDVYVEGISMAQTQRDDFQSVIDSSGMDGLIKSLKERTGEK